VFALGLLAVGVLCALIVVGRRPSDSSAQRRRPTPVETKSDTTTKTTTAAAPTVGTSTSATTSTASAGTNQLRFIARDDTWVSVRRGSSSGAVLFEGTMLANETKTFTGEAFRVRFGAAANVIARLNGQPLSLPGGTYSATITQAGLGPRSP
jgi:hypothetical protein